MRPLGEPRTRSRCTIKLFSCSRQNIKLIIMGHKKVKINNGKKRLGERLSDQEVEHVSKRKNVLECVFVRIELTTKKKKMILDFYKHNLPKVPFTRYALDAKSEFDISKIIKGLFKSLRRRQLIMKNKYWNKKKSIAIEKQIKHYFKDSDDVIRTESKSNNSGKILDSRLGEENKEVENFEKGGDDCNVTEELKACLKELKGRLDEPLNNFEESLIKLKEDKLDCVKKDSSLIVVSNPCAVQSIFDHQGFQFHPRPQTLTVYTLDTVTAQNLNVVGSIPWAWLSEEKWRLHTFAKYPHNTAKSAILLAEDGFAYIGSGKDSDDTVICFFCRAVKRGWREDENIRESHRFLSPDCTMVTGMCGGNVPLSAPDNVSFGRTLLEASAQCGIDKDCSPELSHEASRVGPSRQLQQPRVAQSASSRPKAPIQLATHSVMPPPPNHRSEARQHQAVGNTTALGQASDDRGTSSIVTSSDLAPSFPAADTSEQGRGGQQSTQRSLPSSQSQTATGTGRTNPGRNVPDGGSRTSQANLSTSSAPATVTTSPAPNVATQPSVPITAGQSSTPTTTQSSTPPTAGQSTTSTQSSAPTPTPPAIPQNPTYLELGIITERPKRYEYAVRLKRLETFGEWPADHHLKKEDLADAGFYYAGYGDCARCFYCGGGLRNWEQDDEVWVEHARWFPKCAFIRQRLGQAFIDTVALLAQTNDKISFQMVVSKMNVDPSAFQIDSKETPLKNDAAVVAVREMGYQEKDILSAAGSIKESGQILSADILYTALEDKGVPRKPMHINAEANNLSVSVNRDKAKDEELLNTLKQTNNDLRLQTLCKICMDKEVAVVFLPCGHLVCCTECASAMKDCPVCRNQVKGIVRAFMG
ncbi:hypothetical protein EGW08_002645 [Elysia chlorotica]|uniref:RING-type domain-containing protein n=1 Tax=Elysia chlorotica TaxID=188477 RepID=A0A433U735_ELYCH|nr:hypothetical protein EGW08_002645 [Elysia chlorotica]